MVGAWQQMNQITDKPNTYDFGLSFNYLLWTPGTVVDLCNVKWDSDYRDIVRFSSKSALNAYLKSGVTPTVEIRNLSYVKPNQTVSLNLPINVVMGYNYLRVSNPLQPIPGNDIARDYYYFILDVQYGAPNTTQLVLQLDVYQTFGYDVEFGTCYVERGHIGIANENNFDSFGRRYLTVPEGLNMGTDYRVLTKRTEQVMPRISGDPEKIGVPQFDILIVSTTDLEQDPGDGQDPNLTSGKGANIQGLPSGAAFYITDEVGKLTSWLDTMSDYPWITQGIISITAVPKITRYDPSFEYPAFGIERLLSIAAIPVLHDMFGDWRNNSGMLNFIPARYRHLRKFFTYPYMAIELTAWAATPVVIKPEAWNSENATIMERINYLPPNQRVQFIPRGYNAPDGKTPDVFGNVTEDQLEDAMTAAGFDEPSKVIFRNLLHDKGDDYGDYLDMMTQITAFPSVPILNNAAQLYLASNAHTIQHGRNSADWSQTRALNAAETSRDITAGQRQTDLDLARISRQADALQTGNINRTQAAQAVINGITQGVTGAGQGAVVGGLRGGGPAGIALGAVAGGALSAAGGAINTGIQIAANDEALGIRQSASVQGTTENYNQSLFASNKNYSLAARAARGDYANEIAGINARVQDAELIQPSMVGQYGGDMMNLVNASSEVSIRWKLLDEANLAIVGEYWLRYGYAIRASLTPPTDLKCMTKFTYWKFAESYLIGNIPEQMKKTIRGIFEKGVTVWTSPNDIGNIDWADNQPLSGISY